MSTAAGRLLRRAQHWQKLGLSEEPCRAINLGAACGGLGARQFVRTFRDAQLQAEKRFFTIGNGWGGGKNLGNGHNFHGDTDILAGLVVPGIRHFIAFTMRNDPTC